MNFADKFSVTSIDEDSVQRVGDVAVSPGLYEGGLITVLGQELAAKASIPWTWLIGTDVMPLAVTWSGELFFWSPKFEAVFFLEVQRGRSTFVSRSVNHFFDDFLTTDEVRTQVLRSGEFSAMKGLAGELEYGQCYIQEPWARHGGGPDSGYGRGDIHVYFCLVAQEVEIDLTNQRRG